MEPAPQIIEPAPASNWRRAALALLFIISIVQAIAMQTGSRIHNNDFKHLWAGSRLLARGADPYDPDIMLLAAKEHQLGSINPFVYLPATGLLLRPFSILQFTTAATAWFWFNWFLAWACVVFGPRWLRFDRAWLAQFAGGSFLVGSLPFYRQMTAGQMNVIVLAALILALGLLMRERHGAAGTILGVAAAFKIAPVYLLIILADMRRWRGALAGIATLLLISLATDLWAGWEVHRAALGVLASMSYGSSTWAQFGNDFYRDPFNQSFNSLFHHLFTKNPHTVPWVEWGPVAANVATYLATLVLLLGFALILRRYRRPRCFSGMWGEPESSLYLIGVLVMLLLPSLMWDHYAVQTILVLMAIFGARDFADRPLEIGAAVVSFFLLAYPWIHSAEAWTHGPGIVMMSIRLWGTVLLLGVILNQTRRRMKQRAKPSP